MITVSQLWRYPFKSGAGQLIDSTRVDAEGLSGDRRLLALDDEGVFVTARRHPGLLHLSCEETPDGWRLSHPEQGSHFDVMRDELDAEVSGTLWKDEIEGFDAGDEAAHWLSKALDKRVRVVVWRGQSRFATKYGLQTTFSDASPILLASEASVQQACDWAGIPPDTRRFRPNIVVTGVEAFAEDGWRDIDIGGVRFEVLDTCVRCVLTTIDPDTIERHPSNEPVRSLMQQHASESGQPLFGINVKAVNPSASAVIACGDSVQCR